MGNTFFTGQTGDASAVDQYSAIAGNDWTDGWTVQSSGSNQREKRVLNSDIFAPNGDRYLQVEHKENDSTNTRNMYIARSYTDYEEVVLTEAATIQFYYRVDVDTAFAGGGATYVDIRGGGDRVGLDGSRWGIRTSNGTTKRWTVAHGAGDANFSNINFIDTGVQLNVGDVYKFTIKSDPVSQTWDVNIDNISDANPAFAQTGLGYMDSGSTLGGTLLFGSQIQGVNQAVTPELDSEYTFSLDDIAIFVPETASASLLLVAGALAARRHRDPSR